MNYWCQRNRSNAYSLKLNRLFKESVRIIANFPQIGKPTDDTHARIKMVKDYMIIYEETKTRLAILAIWDSRQDPQKLKELIG